MKLARNAGKEFHGMGCALDGRAVSFDTAVAHAAKLIAASRLPVIAGCGTDIAGARAAVRLADAAGAVIDHMHAHAILRDLDVMREHGIMLTTPNEARRRADVILLVGGGLESAGLSHALPDLESPSLAPLAGGLPTRRILRLGGGGDRGKPDVTASPSLPLPTMLQMLRARVAGHALADNSLVGDAPAREIDTVADALLAARFGVAIWAPAELEALTIEMLCGLIKDLNAGTRWSGLSLPPGDNAAGVLQACGWMSGFPMRTSFARGYPEHDPWLYDAARLVDSGEADCVVWISAFETRSPVFARSIPLIALQPGLGDAASEVSILVGRPGIDHDAVAYDGRLGGLAPIAALTKTPAPSVAEVLDAITAAVREGATC